jgi:hypothetical protein
MKLQLMAGFWQIKKDIVKILVLRKFLGLNKKNKKTLDKIENRCYNKYIR